MDGGDEVQMMTPLIAVNDDEDSGGGGGGESKVLLAVNFDGGAMSSSPPPSCHKVKSLISPPATIFAYIYRYTHAYIYIYSCVCACIHMISDIAVFFHLLFLYHPRHLRPRLHPTLACAVLCHRHSHSRRHHSRSSWFPPSGSPVP